MSNIGIPTWVFQLQPRNSEAREPTTMYLHFTPFILLLLDTHMALDRCANHNQGEKIRLQI